MRYNERRVVLAALKFTCRSRSVATTRGPLEALDWELVEFEDLSPNQRAEGWLVLPGVLEGSIRASTGSIRKPER